jgi:tetratricopeptide (TPR) repeat protein
MGLPGTLSGKPHRCPQNMQALLLLFALTIGAAGGLDAGQPRFAARQDPGSPTAPKPKPNTDHPTQNAPDQPMWDPERAEKDLEVGQYYMRKGDYDAAIDRFNDALLAKPGFAVPFRLLGEAQEKKGLKKKALKSYQKYLDLVPHADDAEKIRKKVEKLEREKAKEDKEK